VGIAIAGLVALAAAMGIGRFAFTPILPMMQADGQVSVATGAWLASANYAGYFLGALSALALSPPPARAIRAGLATIALTTLAMAFDWGLAGWMILRAVAGIASAWVLVAVSAWSLAALAPLGRPALSGAVFAGVGTGIAVAGAACLVLMHAGATAAQAWAVLGVVALGATVFVWPRVGPGSGAGAAAPRAGVARGRGRAESIRLVVCYGLFGFGYIVPATFLPAMARAQIPDPLAFGWSWPLFGLAAALSTPAIALLPAWMTVRRRWVAGHLVLALGVALPAFRPGLGAIMFAALLVGGTFVVITMAGMQEARLVGGGRAAALMAAMTSAFALGQIAGPLSVRYVVNAGGTIDHALTAAAVLVLVAAVALVPGAPRVEPHALARIAHVGRDIERESGGEA
jgi:predicted MFS family arabinose efflux permease